MNDTTNVERPLKLFGGESGREVMTAAQQQGSTTPPGAVAPDMVQALARVTAAVRANDTGLDQLLSAVEQALEGSAGRRAAVWRISGDGTRMRAVAAGSGARAEGGDGGWQPASGPVADVLGARQPIEMGFADSIVGHDRPAADVPVGAAQVRTFARFVPIRHRDRIAAVLGVVREAGEPMFAVTDRIVLDAVVDRIESAFTAQDLRDAIFSASTTSVEHRDGVLLREDLLNRLAAVAGDIAFRHRFGVGTEYISAGVQHSLGFSAQEFTADPGLARRVIHPEDRHIISALMEQQSAFEQPMLIRTIARDGDVAWQFVRLSPIEVEGRIIGCEGLATDVSSMKQTEAELAHQARSDPLTGLANRLTFREFAQRSLARIERHPGMVGVLYLDLTGFKSINDTLGHAAGDQAIVIVAQRLTKVTRREDVVARLGGDEFAVLMPDLADVGEATATAQRIISALESPFTVDGSTASISTGIGVAVTSSGVMTPDELINQADIALYQAKRAGRGRWQVYEGDHGTVDGPANADPASGAPAASQITAGMLRTSLAAGDFRVHYLPIVDSITGEARAVEALVRWQHPELGLIPASMFIEEAEAADIIHTLGDWVLAQACRHVQEWRDRLGIELDLHVNVTGEQLAQPGFSESVLTTLAATGTAPRRLGIEVPEQVIANISPAVEATLGTLHKGGVRIVIDHFGSGSSSLRTLRRVPVDTIKLDRALVDELGRETSEGITDAEIAELAVKLAASLGAGVVAVGIERGSQISRLAELGCTLFQGDVAGPALSSEELPTHVADGRLSYGIRLAEAGWTVHPD